MEVIICINSTIFIYFRFLEEHLSHPDWFGQGQYLLSN